MTFQKNSPGVFEFSDTNPLAEGVLIKVQENVGPSKSMLYTLEINEKPINIWGSTMLDQNMVGVKVGAVIQIVYGGLGEAKPGKNAPKLFEVYVDDGKEESNNAVSDNIPDGKLA